MDATFFDGILRHPVVSAKQVADAIVGNHANGAMLAAVFDAKLTGYAPLPAEPNVGALRHQT